MSYDAPIPPEVHPPAEEPRPWVWWVVLSVFLLLVGSTLGSYFKNDPIEQAFGLQRQALESAIDSPIRREENLKSVIHDLEPYRQTHASAQRMSSIAKHMMSPVGESETSQLVGTMDPECWATALALNPGRPTPETAELVEKLAPKDAIGKYLTQTTRERAGLSTGNDGGKMRRAGAIGALFLATFLAGCFALFTYVTAWREGRTSMAGFPAVPLSLGEAESMALRMALTLLFTYGINPMAALPYPWGSLATIAMFFGLLTVPILGHRVPWKRLFGQPKWSDLGWALHFYIAQAPLVAVGAVVAIVLSLVLPKSYHPLNESISRGESLWILLLGASVLAPLMEEVLFRGLLCQAITRKMGVTSGIILSSLAFASIHPQGIPMWFALAVVGSAACLTYRQTGSLWACIYFHGIHNAVLVMIGFSLR